MKLYFLALLLALSVGGTQAADDPATKQELEERVIKLSADVEGLLAANVALQKSLSRVVEEVRSLREEQTRQANASNVQDELKHLAEKIVEVDKKREADKELIIEQISKLGKTLAPGPGGTGSRGTDKKQGNDTPGSTEKTDRSNPSEKGYEYSIQKGDILATVVADFNAEFKKKGMKPVTLKQVLDANPGLKPEKMHVGQKIFIPQPSR